MVSEMESRRLYIGGISDSVLENDIKAKFGEFGRIKNVEIRCKENYGNRRYFAYVDIETDSKSIDKCVHQCNNLQWKGGCLKVQPAKESFLQKTQKEILERKSHSEGSTKACLDHLQQISSFHGQQSSKEQKRRSSHEDHNDAVKEEQMEIDHREESHNKETKKDQHLHCDRREEGLSTQQQTNERDHHENEWDSHRHASKRDSRIMENLSDKQNDYRTNQRWSNKRSARDEGSHRGDNRESFGDRRANRKGDFIHVGANEASRRAEDPFESQRNDLFEDIDAADELGGIEDEVPDLDDEAAEKSKGHENRSEENEHDPISETQLKKLFDGANSQSFTLSSLFVDQLKVEQLPSSDEEDEGGRFSRRSRRNSEGDDRFGEEYWRRAEDKGKSHQRSWEEMRRRPPPSADQTMNRVQQSFFLLPGDPRLNEGSNEFQTEADPSQFIDAWAEQAEQLTLRLFQRKSNARTQKQMAERLSAVHRVSKKKKMTKNNLQLKKHSQ